MNRMTLLFTAAFAIFTFPGEIAAQTLELLDSRVTAIEKRLAAIESKLNGTGLNNKGNELFTEVPGKTHNYVIRDGDSIGGIARKFGIPRQALLNANNMAEGQPIFIGETLLVPAAPEQKNSGTPGGVVHVVQGGDTLIGLSRKYGSTVAAIKAANSLSSDVIGKGQQLIIPTDDVGTTLVTTKAVQTGPSKFQYDNPLLKNDETYGFYAVQKGDNLYALARDFFTSMKELQRLNQLGTSTTIYPGDELIVPTSKYNAYHKNVAGY